MGYYGLLCDIKDWRRLWPQVAPSLGSRQGTLPSYFIFLRIVIIGYYELLWVIMGYYVILRIGGDCGLRLLPP